MKCNPLYTKEFGNQVIEYTIIMPAKTLFEWLCMFFSNRQIYMEIITETTMHCVVMNNLASLIECKEDNP